MTLSQRADNHHAERPRERLMAHGAHVLTSPELLAIILRTGTRGCDAVTLGQRLIAHFGSLRELLSADAAALRCIKGVGVAKASELLAINELNRRALEEDLKTGVALDQPER